MKVTPTLSLTAYVAVKCQILFKKQSNCVKQNGSPLTECLHALLDTFNTHIKWILHAGTHTHTASSWLCCLPPQRYPLQYLLIDPPPSILFLSCLFFLQVIQLSINLPVLNSCKPLVCQWNNISYLLIYWLAASQWLSSLLWAWAKGADALKCPQLYSAVLLMYPI